MKRVIAVAFVLVLCLSLVPITVFADNYSGECGENVSWELDTSTGVLTISGEGFVWAYRDEEEVPWYSYKDSITSVIIKEGVTGISDSNFGCCENITSVVIPASVTNISRDAFDSRNSSIKSVYISDLSNWCEFECWNAYISNADLYLNDVLVTELVIPKGVGYIGEYAFKGFKSITSVAIPTTVVKIGYDAFDECINLKSVYIEDIAVWCNGITFERGGNPLSDGADLYLDNEIVTDLKLHAGIDNIKEYAFEGCTSIEKVTIPDSVKSIEHGAFEDCDNLKSITLPDSVETIGEAAFYGCDELVEVTLPSSLTFIDKGLLSGCTNLAKVTIPDSVTTIDDYVFEGCASLASIIIPDSVTGLGNGCFSNCKKLTDIYCEAQSQPSGWDGEWLEDCNATVHWGYSEAENTSDSTENAVSESETTQGLAASKPASAKTILLWVGLAVIVIIAVVIVVKRA